MIRTFKTFNESSDGEGAWHEIQRLRSEIEDMESKIRENKRRIDSLSKASGNTRVSGPEGVIEELKKNPRVKFVPTDEVTPVQQPNGTNYTFDLINPHGVRITVTFEETHFSSDVFALALAPSGKERRIDLGPRGLNGIGVKEFVSRLLGVTPEWVESKGR